MKVWNDIEHQRNFMQTVAKKLKIQNLGQWYGITHSTLLKHGGSELLAIHNDSLFSMFQTVYPEYLHLHTTTGNSLPYIQVGYLQICTQQARILGRHF